MMNEIKTLVQRGKTYLIAASLVISIFVFAGYKGYRLLDLFGNDRWEQGGPGTTSHYHK